MSCYRIWLNGLGEYVEVEADSPRQALKAARALYPSTPITGINERTTA
jgi:hypothetical protein